MYTMCFQLLNGRPQEVTFDTERDMEDYYNIWVAGDDYHYCDFFDNNVQYDPAWME